MTFTVLVLPIEEVFKFKFCNFFRVEYLKYDPNPNPFNLFSTFQTTLKRNNRMFTSGRIGTLTV